jgi:hypothetical protein
MFKLAHDYKPSPHFLDVKWGKVFGLYFSEYGVYEAGKEKTHLPDKVPLCEGLVGSTVGRPAVELTTSPLLDSVP